MDDPRATTDSDSLDSFEDPIPLNLNHADTSQGVSEMSDSSDTPCTIYLTSHGHRFGPFSPPPPGAGDCTLKVLQYDIRALPNPPKNVRAQQTGLHKALREWFFSRPEAVAKLGEVCAEIDATLAQFPKVGLSRAELHVVVFCEMGKHRSVAFIEELARHLFFVERDGEREKCAVVVQHRDVARAKHDPRSRRQRTDRSEM
ncbi:hypothetical protein B0H19DRAFT_1382744 [Mycena capillaripes]|nr:hypothetical protein B0H19DRAFT_1382744 [Mycena capillaripes]